jgi:hypothetical protein
MADEFDAIYQDPGPGPGVNRDDDDVLNLGGCATLVPDPIVVRGAGNITV